MKTIFHFNCVVCGAHPAEEPFDRFEWPKSRQMLESFLDALSWILPNIQSASWTARLRDAIGQSIQRMGDRPNAVPLHRFDGADTVFTIRCPLCGTSSGPRPYDRYFHAWIAWHAIDGIQVGNVLFESSMLLARIGGKDDLVSALKKAIESLDMQVCCCGRPTTALNMTRNAEGAGLCRWCMDSRSESKPSIPDNSFHAFVNDLNLSRFLAVTPETWSSIRSALLKDFDEGNRTPLHLYAALIGNPTGKWLEPWRRTFQRLGSWPEMWQIGRLEDEEIQEEPSIPLSYSRAYETYCRLPREVIDPFPWRGRPISPPVRSILEEHALIELGQPSDIEGFLEQSSMARVREISNQVHAGKGRSKEMVIKKILSGATPDDIINAVPEIRNGWVKAVGSPFDALPQDWVRYQWLKAVLLNDFVQRKSWSHRDIHDSLPKRIELHASCSDYCKAKVKVFRWAHNSSLNDVPPWYPGCMCLLRTDVATLLESRKK